MNFDWLVDWALSTPVTVAIAVLSLVTGISGVVGIVAAVVKGIRWLLARRSSDKPKTAAAVAQASLPYASPPRWEIRIPDSGERDKFALFNVGLMEAREVRLLAEDDEVVISGVLDWHLLPAGKGFPFEFRQRPMNGLFETWLVVLCKDANGIAREPTRLKVPGVLPY